MTRVSDSLFRDTPIGVRPPIGSLAGALIISVALLSEVFGTKSNASDVLRVVLQFQSYEQMPEKLRDKVDRLAESSGEITKAWVGADIQRGDVLRNVAASDYFVLRSPEANGAFKRTVVGLHGVDRIVFRGSCKEEVVLTVPPRLAHSAGQISLRCDVGVINVAIEQVGSPAIGGQY